MNHINNPFHWNAITEALNISERTNSLIRTDKKRYALLLLLIIAFSQVLIAQKTEYYRHLVFRESPYSDLKGIHPINQNKSEKEAHYRFVYDDQDRLTEVSYRIGKDLISDNNNNWDSFIWFSSKVTISYSEGKEIRHFYNHYNERSEVHGKMYKAEFDLNSQGKRTAVRFYDKDDKPSENAWGIHTYKWFDHDEESVMEERFDLQGNSKTIRPNFTFYKIKLVYGNDDFLDFMYHLDDDGNLMNNTMKAAMDRIVYDNEGNFSRWMVFDKDKKPVEGNGPDLAIGEHLYDARGNKVGLRGYDVSGNLKAMPSGVAREVNSYDSFNNKVEAKTYNLEGDLLQRVKRIYSSDGKRLEWVKFLDEEGNLVYDSQNQFAALKLEYTNDLRVASVVRFDAEMKEIKTL